ncbi:MAG: 2-amino-4-hydroxy-6-hydroxymethyldihydropteridine diphosphokinase [Candidatus Dadabacteria bacterium]|nr:MAG: 2-amino-4-hydroxy-6-hydroxymethyldihydropteridine diphosphokinase [Candidatus Dadabacteria bacterium]
MTGVSNVAYIGVGSNLGDRLANYRKAVAAIGQIRGTRVTRESSLYESEPHGRARNWFLNGVVEVVTELEAKELLKELQKIEASMGRKRSKTTVSRTIDLDILLFNDETIDTRTLKVPHPELPNRRFVLLPLSELAPALRHPELGETISALLVTTKDDKKVTFFKP